MGCMTESVSSAAIVWVIAKSHGQVNTGFKEKIIFIELKTDTFIYLLI